MKWPSLLPCLAVVLLCGCFDPMVGSQCEEKQVLCGARCVPSGACALDSGIDSGGLDGAHGEATAEAGAQPSALDTASPVDWAEGLDEGYDGAASIVDGQNGDRPLRFDGPSLADAPAPDLRDTAPADTRRADGPDAASVTKDTQNATSQDTRDVATQSNKDGPILANEDAPDAPSNPDLTDAPLPDAPAQQPEVPGDATVALGPDCTDAQDTSDLADAARDAYDGRKDVPGPESGPDTHPSCPAQQAKCAGVCVDLQTSQANCGLCGYDCSPLSCIAGQCTSCPISQTLCDNRCVDTSVDPANCGGCGQVCESGACRFGVCKAGTAGHIVIIGHDFQTNNVAMSRLLGNAILQLSSGDVSVVEYLGVAGATAVSNSHVAITQVSNTFDRKVTLLSDVSFSASALATQLTPADVFLIQSQTVATNTILAELGQTWSSVLSTFVHTGGTIVVLDGSYPVNKGTSQIVSHAGLMNISVLSSVNGDTCTIATATDPVAASVPTSYPCLQNSVVFSGDGTHVVEDLGRPVVLHLGF